MTKITRKDLVAGFLEYALADLTVRSRRPSTRAEWRAYLESVSRLVTAAREAASLLESTLEADGGS